AWTNRAQTPWRTYRDACDDRALAAFPSPGHRLMRCYESGASSPSGRQYDGQTTRCRAGPGWRRRDRTLRCPERATSGHVPIPTAHDGEQLPVGALVSLVHPGPHNRHEIAPTAGRALQHVMRPASSARRSYPSKRAAASNTPSRPSSVTIHSMVVLRARLDSRHGSKESSSSHEDETEAEPHAHAEVEAHP